MKAHRTDGISLAFGLILLAIVGAWLIVRSVDVGFPAFGWFVAVALIAFGVVGLASSLRLGRRDSSAATADDQIRPDDDDQGLASLDSVDTDKS